MEKLYSKINKELLHVIHRVVDFGPSRNDFSPDTEYLQATALCFPSGKIVKAHKHLPQQRETEITQESIVVIKGLLRAIFYDTDDKLLEETTLKAGDCCITFKGGHCFEGLEKDTLFYEFKTGPYKGMAADKTPI